jgi:type III secretion protein S
MNPEDAVHYLSESMVLVMLLSLPPIVVASVVGVVVSLLQALTQVQEQTLPFAIKLIAVAVTIAAMAGILGSEMLNYTEQIFSGFPAMVR